MNTVWLYTLGSFGGIVAIYLLGVFLSPHRPNAVKNDHFECGLPSSSSMPQKANFGYFVFAILFIVVDMAGLFFSLFVFSDDPHALTIMALFAMILFVALSIAMKTMNAHSGMKPH
jgi:NADH-quinone oxidoreductase subunit A